MALEVLATCVAICKFFHEQRELNDEAKEVLKDLKDYVKRLLDPLQTLLDPRHTDTRGLEIASEQLHHLWDCLRNSQRIYEKYKNGWKFAKLWVTPGKILAKAKTQEKKTRHAWVDLSTTLQIAIRKKMQPITAHAAAETKTDDTSELPAKTVNIDLNILGDPKEPLQPNAPAAAKTKTDDHWPPFRPCALCTWDLPPNTVSIDLTIPGIPKELLGKGSSSVVGLGAFSDGRCVAVKMALAPRLADAARDPQVVESFRRGVNLLCIMHHPNIVECYGSITHMNGAPCMWIVMEKLDITLFAAITEKHLQLGRDEPRTYVDLVAGIFSALTFLHNSVDETPIVHRDLKPENIMLNNIKDRVVKLIDFDMSQMTVSGECSPGGARDKAALAWGTKSLEYVAPEIQGGGCSVASDVWSAALVALFIWWGKTPHQNPDRGKIEESADFTANFTQQLMLRCLNENSKERPTAAAVSFELDRLVNPPTERPSAPPVGGMIFLERIDIKDQEEQKKLLDAGIRLKDDLLDLEMEDLADVFKDLALSTRKRLKRFVELSREEKVHVLAGDVVASSSPAAASFTTTTSSSPPPPSKPSVLILAPAHSLQAAESNGSGG